MSRPFTLKELIETGKKDIHSEYETWMQFTGLLDKNGKEIYEGDVCESELGFMGNRYQWVVEWDEKFARFKIATTKKLVEGKTTDEWVAECSVIGNIYEGLLHSYETPDMIEQWKKITGKPYPRH